VLALLDDTTSIPEPLRIIATLMKGVMANCGVSDDLVVAAPPLELPTVDFHMLWHRRTDQHPAHQWLRACIAEAAAN
jgi:DNA-binding transcriptional LysR family regulator